MLGSGFPSTGHVNVFTIPSATKTVSPLFVASTGSLREKKQDVVESSNLLVGLALAYSTFEVLRNHCSSESRADPVLRELVFHKCGQ